MAYSPKAISALATAVVPYDNATPIATKWVSPTGSDTASGSQWAPYKSIQKAVDSALPGTAVMVKAGAYVQNVKLTKSGTVDKPIWLTSADGEGAATIKALNAGIPVIYGHGVDNVVVKGFRLSGGTEGVNITQSGTPFTNLATNIVIEDNRVYGQKNDGIKIAQTTGAAIVGNIVHNIAGQEGIDSVYMRNGLIADNDVYDVRGLSGIVVKAGSSGVRVIDNDVWKVPDGILVGGFSAHQGRIFPGGLEYQAKGMIVQDNTVAASKQAVNVYGAIDSKIIDNTLVSANWNVRVGTDNLGYKSKGITVIDNTVSKSNWLWSEAGSVVLNTANKMPSAAAPPSHDAASIALVGVPLKTDLDDLF